MIGLPKCSTGLLVDSRFRDRVGTYATTTIFPACSYYPVGSDPSQLSRFCLPAEWFQRRRLLVRCHSGAGMWHVECQTGIRFPLLFSTSTKCSYRCCHQSHLRIFRYTYFCQYRALLSSSLLTIASPVLTTFVQGVKFISLARLLSKRVQRFLLCLTCGSCAISNKKFPLVPFFVSDNTTHTQEHKFNLNLQS